jgi:hypothetical protein
VELYLHSPIHLHGVMLNYAQGQLYLFGLSTKYEDSRDSSVGIALDYGLDDRVLGFDSRRGL